jgi:hypothetical protein
LLCPSVSDVRGGRPFRGRIAERFARRPREPTPANVPSWARGLRFDSLRAIETAQASDEDVTRPSDLASRGAPAAPRRTLERIVLGTFVALVGVGIAVHEPWFDEAQAWLLARDASVVDLLTTYLRYEGHPPLWYLILAIPAKLGLPYKSINFVSAAIAVLGVALLLRNRAIPFALRALLPFTYFVAYQYTIVSRSYVLLLPILVSVLAIYSERRERLWTFVGLLVLLSQVSLHGMSLAGALALLYIVDHWPQRRDF